VPGPLDGVAVLELGGIGPAPFGCMLLADLGATVTRIERAGSVGDPHAPERMMGPLLRGRRSIGVDLKQDAGREVVLALAGRSDVVVEAFRPGVAERLGVGPDVLCERDPALVYARMTGWGQDGPLAPRAGHDLTYAALAGAIHPIGAADRPPPPPLSLLGDFGGGGAYLAIGVLAALHERTRSGRGQVLDVAMVDGVASLAAIFSGMAAAGLWSAEREANLLDGGAPCYRTYETADGGFMAVAALEPQFYAELLERLGLDPAAWPQHDRTVWPDQRKALAELFRTRTRAEWEAVFEGSDACVGPVLRLDEAPDHPHIRARGTYVDVDGVPQAAAAPRFSRTPGAAGRVVEAGRDTDAVLADAGLSPDRVAELRAAGAVA
jgi:alpha-methylacyl-CoA racemase